jgi:glutamate racemase
MNIALSPPERLTGCKVQEKAMPSPVLPLSSVDPAAPILLFDSGVGGLTVLGELRKVLPQAPVIYAADMAGLPYGTKTEAQVTARVAGLLGRMTERFAPRLVCIACNTASTIALGMVREVLEVPVVGTVPAIKPAAAMTRTGVIGLLGTQATIRQAYVDRLEQEFAGGKRLLRYGGPGLVEAAEAKLRGERVDPAAITRAAEALRAMPGGEDIDTVVLACTHFPLLEEELAQAFGPGVRFVHGAEGIARRIAQLTDRQEFARQTPDRALFTGPGEFPGAYGAALARYGLPEGGRF